MGNFINTGVSGDDVPELLVIHIQEIDLTWYMVIVLQMIIGCVPQQQLFCCIIIINGNEIFFELLIYKGY